jgi:hypothetical protein
MQLFRIMKSGKAIDAAVQNKIQEGKQRWHESFEILFT